MSSCSVKEATTKTNMIESNIFIIAKNMFSACSKDISRTYPFKLLYHSYFNQQYRFSNILHEAIYAALTPNLRDFICDKYEWSRTNVNYVYWSVVSIRR